MTNNLRDRLAAELDDAITPMESLAPSTIAKGHSRLRVRRLGITSIAAIAILGGASWIGTSLNSSLQDHTVVADPSVSAGIGARSTTPSEAHGNWDETLAAFFTSTLPEGFDGVTQSGGADTGQALQFLATGPAGEVQLNAMVYLNADLPAPSCARTIAQQCRTVSVNGGQATVRRNVYTNKPALPQASTIFVTQGNVQTIVNVVEEKPGQSQFSITDLIRLAQSGSLTDAIAFATSNASALKDYGVTTPGN